MKPNISERTKVIIAAVVIIVASVLAIILTLFAFRAELIGVMVTLLTGAIGSLSSVLARKTLIQPYFYHRKD